MSLIDKKIFIFIYYSILIFPSVLFIITVSEIISDYLLIYCLTPMGILLIPFLILSVFDIVFIIKSNISKAYKILIVTGTIAFVIPWSILGGFALMNLLFGFVGGGG